jgi:hypothetical protein
VTLDPGRKHTKTLCILTGKQVKIWIMKGMRIPQRNSFKSGVEKMGRSRRRERKDSMLVLRRVLLVGMRRVRSCPDEHGFQTLGQHYFESRIKEARGVRGAR